MDFIIIRHLLILSVFVLWTSGLADGNNVIQPAMLWENKGDDVTIECRHTKDASYNQMYWYRQLPGEAMRQILFYYANNKPDYEPDFTEEKFPANKTDAYSGTLTVKDLEPGDKGLYFCAVSEHSDTETLSG